MSTLPTTPHHLKQPSPDNQGLEKAKPADLNEQAAGVNRDIPALEKKSPQKHQNRQLNQKK